MNLSQSHDSDRKFNRLVQVDINFRLGFIENILGEMQIDYKVIKFC